MHCNILLAYPLIFYFRGYCLTSATLGSNVDKLFKVISEDLLKKPWKYPNIYKGSLFKIISVLNICLINNDIILKLGTYYPMLYLIQVSLDGLEQSYDNVRGKESFKKAILGLETVIKNTKIATNINCTLTRENIHEISELIDLGKNLGVSKILFTRMVPIGHGARFFKGELSPQEVRDVLNNIYQKGQDFIPKLCNSLTIQA